MLGFCGLMAIDSSAAAFTTNVASALTEPELMPIVVVPVPSVLASPAVPAVLLMRSEEHTSELQSQSNLVCRLLLEKKNMRLTSICAPITETATRVRIASAASCPHPALLHSLAIELQRARPGYQGGSSPRTRDRAYP